MIIGICGYSQVGKDTLANELVTRNGFQRIAFADAMRNILYELNPLVTTEVVEIQDDNEVVLSDVFLQDLVDKFGWETTKVAYPEVRKLLQRLGTEAGRKFIAENVWIRTVFDRQTNDNLVIPDVRFTNEADEIKERGGVIVRIVRDGVEPVNNHLSEISYTDQDLTIPNNGTPEELHRNFRIALASFQQSQQP